MLALELSLPHIARRLAQGTACEATALQLAGLLLFGFPALCPPFFLGGGAEGKNGVELAG